MKMRQKIYCGFMLMLSILFVACADDELYRSFSSSQVVKVKNLQLVASDVVEKEISLTRAADQPALLNSAMLFIFNEAGSREAVLDLVHADLTQYTDQNNDRVYTVTKEIELTVGTKTCYAIANIDNFSYLAIHKNEIGNITTQSELESYLLSINPTTVTTQGLPTIYETETQILPFTGQGKLQITETSEGNGTAKGIVNLYRPIAHIAFNINTSSENSEGSICNFALNNYTVYKVADCYPVFSIAENVIGTEEDSRQYYNTLQMQSYTESGGQAKFDFYIPENIQNSADDVANYHEREKWNYNTSVDGMKDWSYAPDNATYVVISGQYTETTKDGTLKYSGDVSYTIHLGDFSDDKWGNFSVERNCKYTYTVSIKGVNNIIVEVTKGEEKQPGAEGNIIDTQSSQQIFDLDCHYEQAYVSYNLQEIADGIKTRFDNQHNLPEGEQLTVDELIGNSYILKASTPFAPNADFIMPYAKTVIDRETEENATDGMDYKWIYFLSQPDDKIAKYPGTQCESTLKYSEAYKTDKYLLNPYELCVSLGELTKMIYENQYKEGSHNLKTEASNRHIDIDENYIVRFTAFIDENYYLEDPLTGASIVGWDKFTRQDDRSMLIASNIQISADGKSTYTTARTAFIQRSIQTFYKAAYADETNAMGLETYCENPIMNDNLSLWNSSSEIATSTTDGWTNTKQLVSYKNNNNYNWDSYINIGNNGYAESNSSLPEKHFINDILSGNEQHPYYACLSRNRDLDGNGKIDENELRWYLPASDQYLRLSIGADAMSERSRLFWGEDKRYATPKKGQIYYTSTYQFLISGRDTYSKDKQVLWAAEEGAFGAKKDENAGLVRCVRNLPSTELITSSANKEKDVNLVNATANGDVLYALKQSNSGNYIFDFEDRLDARISRTDIYTGAYPYHTEEGDANKLPLGFVVARKDCTEGTYWGERLLDVSNNKSSIWDATSNPCDSYSEGTGAGAQGRWRVPNLREMMVMSSQAEQLGFFNHNVANYYYIISTDYSGKDSGFAYTAKVDGQNRGFITTELSNFPVYVRCIRDMTEAD